jgi:hypothetical protein
MKTLPQPRMMALEAAIFTGWIYDHLLPHAKKVKVAHPSSVPTLRSLRPQMDVRFCLRAGTISREANVRSYRIPIRPTTRSPARVRKTRAFLLTMTYMDGGDSTGINYRADDWMIRVARERHISP